MVRYAVWLVVVLLMVGCGTAVPAPTPTPKTMAIAPTNTATLALPTPTPLPATSTSTPIPSIAPTVISTPTATKVSTAEIHIVSEPSGALVSITNDSLPQQTPLTWTTSSGTYTLTLMLDGYEDWITPITVTEGSQITMSATLHQHHTVIPIQDIFGPLYSLRWSEDGQSLTYALLDSQWPDYVRFLPTYQTWWRYDIGSSDIQPLTPPHTRVTDAVRESLGVCPFASPDDLPYSCLTTLQESPISNRIAFSSGNNGPGEANTWLANIDGSGIIYLDTLPGTPTDVMWSSDGKWLLIGRSTELGGNHIYYLVSSDGTFVESLEDITNTSQWVVQGVKPQFSPDGQKVAFVGIETGDKDLTWEQVNQEDAYNIYVLDLTTLKHQLVSPRFGFIQWDRDGSGLYLLDGSGYTAAHEGDYLFGGFHYADFYYVDLTQETFHEQKLATDIPIRPAYSSTWAYSPEENAIAGIFVVEDRPIFSILLLK